MQRWIARTLLVLLLVGVLAPAALAMGAPSPHACCMRKPSQPSPQQAGIGARECTHHECCRSLAVSHWAQTEPARSISSAQPSADVLLPTDHRHRPVEPRDSQLDRGPPSYS